MTKTSVSGKTKTSLPRLTSRQWAEATALYEAGEMTIAQLAAKFDKHRDTFAVHFKKHGVVRGSKAKEHIKEIADEVAKRSTEEASVLAIRIKETKDEHYKMSAGLAKLTWAEIVDSRVKHEPISARLHNLKALDIAMSVLKKAREERFAVLGLDRDDYVAEEDLPELVISELTAGQIERMRASDETDLGEAIDTIATSEVPDLGIEDADSSDVVEES